MSLPHLAWVFDFHTIQPHDHRLRLAVDRDLLSVTARYRSVGAFPLQAGGCVGVTLVVRGR
uniref:hypothetical protein n=1 Tax=Streptomyces sp. NBC_01562 TaxID=2975879 RepID=UPI003BA87C72